MHGCDQSFGEPLRAVAGTSTFEVCAEGMHGDVGLNSVLVAECGNSFEGAAPGCVPGSFIGFRPQRIEPRRAFIEGLVGDLGDAGANKRFALLEVFSPLGVDDAARDGP
jgi:hypothetical protein